MLVCRHVCVRIFFFLFHACVLHIYTTYALLVSHIHGSVLHRLKWSGKRSGQNTKTAFTITYYSIQHNGL